ncbi:MAG: tRNA (adenine-N1)-methyltransferase [Candidatus Aenigmarchaeota archaeon]|nr:tRNA (adenine-N1)-methyltransferase [Candidatus Aenigmarchaeota archaeon]
MRIKIGELILLLSKEESYLLEVSDKDFHTKSGVIRLGEIIGKNYGEKIKTHLGKEFTLVEPNIVDILERRIERMAQVILPKDISLIITTTGVSADSLVVDAGTGSGYTAIFLANYVKPRKVVTYEIDKRFIKLAEENIEKSGLKKYIKLKKKDVMKGIDEKNVDLVTLDMKGVEKVVKHAYKVLKPGGWLVVYSPNIEQVTSVHREIVKKNFCDVKTIENIVREWQVKKYTRPKTMGIMHTGFLTFARKVG